MTGAVACARPMRRVTGGRRRRRRSPPTRAARGPRSGATPNPPLTLTLILTLALALALTLARTLTLTRCDPDFCTCIDAGLSHDDLVRRVQVQERKVPSGLPECLWPPPSGCTKDAVYECMQGPNAGRCGEENWFDKKD